MRGRARRLWWVAAPLLLVAASGCSTGRPFPWSSAGPREPAPARPANRLVAEADDLARRGQGSAAHATYERVLREYPGDPAGAAALYGIGRLQTDPAAGLRNYRAAHRTFSRLLADYPDSHFEADARAWRTIITELLAREDDAVRVKEDAGRVREEAVRLRMQIEQLRRTDLDLERRR
ncbi:MAG TPA: tetratricopeptide repeat protein [Methylomirabilota bacterium]|nr:tetratricopeptide repeat protein [Methylomirabilota bacterium]